MAEAICFPYSILDSLSATTFAFEVLTDWGGGKSKSLCLIIQHIKVGEGFLGYQVDAEINSSSFRHEAADASVLFYVDGRHADVVLTKIRGNIGQQGKLSSSTSATLCLVYVPLHTGPMLASSLHTWS